VLTYPSSDEHRFINTAEFGLIKASLGHMYGVQLEEYSCWHHNETHIHGNMLIQKVFIFL
jgi:hypothetical protein